MTTTSPGAHEFPTKYLVVALAAVLSVAAMFAIAQWAGTESRPSAAPPSGATFEVSTEVAEPSAGPSGLTQALADGKLDAGFIPTPSPKVAESDFVPETVVVSGQGGLYEALIDGKFGLDFASQNPGVQYVRGPEATLSVGGLRQALADSKLDAGLIPTPNPIVAESGFLSETVVVSGQGGLYDALIDGKFGLDFASQNPGVQYVRGPEATISASGLRQAFAEGKLDAGSANSEPTTQPSPAAPRAPTLSGGHQQ